MNLHGWGRFPQVESEIIEPVDRGTIKALLTEPTANGQLIARGAGRSYGDSSLGETVLGTRFLDNFLRFDTTHGTLGCAAGVTLDQILTLIVPRGWILPVLPGTCHVSVGGAIASDIHGKNHHRDGCFSNFVESITLLLASGEIVRCGPNINRHLFHATCGGMGLTGIILEARLKLEKISSAYIEQQTVTARNLADVFSCFDQHAPSKYSVAWVDCLATGDRRGRSVLFTGEPASRGGLDTWTRRQIPVPPFSPGQLLNRYSIGLFNRLYYGVQLTGRKHDIPYYRDYFFPLDWMSNWNRLYGPKGFIQYQFVVPEQSAREAIDEVLAEISSQGKGSFLTVLKKMGPENRNLLSFPMEGYTLALDFKIEDSLFPLLERLDAIVMHHGGRLYLCKDARMSEAMFKQTYPRWEQFQQLRSEIDPKNRLGSWQSRRLGLGP